MKRAKVTVVVALAVALGAAACSSPASTSGDKGGSSSIKVQHNATDPNAKGPAADVPGAKHGGTITVDSESTPSTFDPTDIYYTDSGEIAKLLFRTPTQYRIESDGTPVLVPDLTDLGTPSADGLSWTFKMTGSYKYEDGTAVTIQDLAYAIKRSFARDLFVNGPTYQLDYFQDGDTYKGPWKSGDSYSGVETPDAQTLVIHLKKAFPSLPFYMSFPMFTPIPQAKDTKENYKNHPLATGPYMFKTYTPGAELVLVKNTNWDPATDAVRHQYADEFDFKWGGNDLKSQQAVLDSANSVDATTINYANIDASLISQIEGGKKAQLIQGDSPCNIVTQLDTRKIPIEVRKAIATAYPYDQIWTANGNNDYIAEPSSTILPPSVPGYTAYTPYPGLSGTGKGDPVAAKAMLTAAAKIGFELSYYYNNTDPIAQQVNQIRTTALEAAGFTVKAIGVAPADLRAKTGDYTNPVNMGQAPGGWCSDWPSGTSWFPVLFESQDVAQGLSWGMLGDTSLDAQIEAVSALPADQQTAKWGALDKQIMGMYVVLPRWYDKMAIVQGTGLGGTNGDGTQGMPDFLNMYVK